MWTGADNDKAQKVAVIREHLEAVVEGNHALAARIRAANPDLFEWYVPVEGEK